MSNINKHWKSKYFETNIKESHVNIFRSLEIKNYLKQLLRKKGLCLHSYRLNFSNSTLTIFISLYEKNRNNQNQKKNFKNRKTKLLTQIHTRNILKSLNKFTNNKLHIILKTLVINDHIQQNLPKINFNLYTFKTPEIKNLYPLVATQKDSAKLLGLFIAEQLKTTKRHNFLLGSLSKSLSLLIKQKQSKIKGIKILIKGRLNNAARSRNQYIKIGTIPLITKSIFIDYSESTAFTSNGTIGVKVWISHKKLDLSKSNISKTVPVSFLKSF